MGYETASTGAPAHPGSTRSLRLKRTRRVDRFAPFLLLVVILVLSALTSSWIRVPQANGVPAGGQFDHIVIVAMENQNYASVLGSGTGNSAAPFLSSLLASSSTVPNYHSYGAGIGGCSAGCYEAFSSGQQSHSDGWCPRASSPCFTITNVADRLSSAGLSSAMFCEDGCPRGADHFPWIAYTSTWNTCVTGSFTCTGQTGPDGNALYGSSSGNGNSAFISYLNSASPASYIWFTPTDSHNMHDNSISSGDQYLQTLLVGSGTVNNPSGSSVLGSSLFNGSTRTWLYIWWDEYDPSPNLELGKGPTGFFIKPAFISTSNTYTEYASLHTILNNWGLNSIQNDAAAPLMSDIFGTSGPAPLSTTFGLPPSPVAGSPQTLQASAAGGTSPYSFSWNFGDGSTGTGQTVTHTWNAGTYSITLTASDAASHTASSTQSLTVPQTGGCTTNCCPSTGCPPPPNTGQLVGWGGIRLDEASTTGLRANTLNLPSCCFSNEFATNMQLVLQRMKTLGYNAVRVDFDPFCTDNTDSNYMSAYSAANLQRAITIAQAYNFWLIVDYHGYTDIIAGSSTGLVQSGYSDLRSCWLGFWSGVVTQFKGSYNKLIWEPLNEPKPASGSDVATLSSGYQAWINQARQIGDTHWIVVGNICSFGCTLADYSQGYPTVTDSQNRVFINLHAYMGFPYVSPWTTAEADTYAYQFYQWMLAGQSRTGWTSLNTEIGADPLCSLTACPNAGWGQCSSPPTACGGSAGYTTVTYEFVRDLTQLMNQNSPAISWIGWTAGSWTDTPGAPLYGALDPTNWGTNLGTQTPTNSTGTGGGGGGFLNIFLNPTVQLLTAAGIISLAAAIGLSARKKRGVRPAT